MRTDRSEAGLIDRDERRRHYARWFVQLRWIALAVSLVLILVAVPFLHLLPTRTLLPLSLWWLALLIANVWFRRRVEGGREITRQIFIQGSVDLVVLTGLLNASGGLENPLYIVFLFHVILGGILLPKRQAAGLTLVASLLFLLLSFGEYFKVLPHYAIGLFPHESADESADHGDTHSQALAEHASHDIYFVFGRTVPFLAVLLLTAYFTALIMERLRHSEHDLEEVARRAMFDRRRLEGVVDAAGLGMMQVGPEIQLRWFSRRIADWFGWGESSVGSRCPLLEDPEGCPQCVAALTADSGQAHESERREVLDGGVVRYFRHTTTPVRDHDGSVAQVVEVVEDVTTRKALEAEAVHAGKLSVLGRMAAGIAHEIGNPLSSLSARLNLLERRTEPSYVEESIKVLHSQIDRIRRIVHGVSHFARLRRQRWTVWDLNELVEEAIGVVRLDRRSRAIAFDRRLARPALQIQGVRDQILQVTLNLLLNAVEAMPGQGTVTVETREQDHQGVLSVADTGCGMDDETRAHLFEPFFSTKNEGTGLGLSISYSLVHAHGGRIEVESSPGQGSRLTAYLPLVGGRPSRASDHIQAEGRTA